MSALLTFQEQTASDSQFPRNIMSDADIYGAINANEHLQGMKAMAGYDDRDGKIWMDGKLIDWREANVHILTHAMHYASSVFEGERAYNGRIFKSREHSERLKASAEYIDFEIDTQGAL